jgi:hypothetical protein
MKNQTISSLSFIVTWHVTTTFFLVLYVLKSKLDSFFHIQCSAEEAEFVLIQKENTPQVIFQQSDLLTVIGRFEAVIRRALGYRFLKNCTYKLLCLMRHCRLEKTFFFVPVQTSHVSDLRYFEFESVRHVYSQTLLSFEVTSQFPMHIGEKMEKEPGLSTSEAEARQELIGGNFIHVPLEGFFNSLLTE